MNKEQRTMCKGSSKKKRVFFLLLFSLFTFNFSFAQTSHPAGAADRLEALFNTPKLNYEQAAAFVLEAADITAISQAEAFRYATERNWLPKNAEARDTARLDGISLLIMKAFEIKGGAFYSVFQNAHYAYRELEYRKIIEGKTLPSNVVSGELLLFIIGRTLSYTEVSEQ